MTGVVPGLVPGIHPAAGAKPDGMRRPPRARSIQPTKPRLDTVTVSFSFRLHPKAKGAGRRRCRSIGIVGCGPWAAPRRLCGVRSAFQRVLRVLCSNRRPIRAPPRARASAPSATLHPAPRHKTPLKQRPLLQGRDASSVGGAASDGDKCANKKRHRGARSAAQLAGTPTSF
jgi:hypothetical protein